MLVGAAAATTYGDGGGAKEIERRRRQQMKALCARLASRRLLIFIFPDNNYMVVCMQVKMNQFDILDAVVSYIKELKEMVEQLEQQRSSAAKPGGVGSEEAPTEEMAVAPVVLALLQPQDGSILDVAVICSVRQSLILHEVITVLEEEGAERLYGLNCSHRLIGRLCNLGGLDGSRG
uniref:BHLH domain-containing protein n=1 Tax=Setaria viridis TaxID=4556 RepID=A0A4U6TC97_SETVI|nr:hypothetical protein SEVIR_8G059300v2 [Setaria viridis]